MGCRKRPKINVFGEKYYLVIGFVFKKYRNIQVLTVPAIQRNVKIQFCRRFLRVLVN